MKASELFVNRLLQWHVDDNTSVERILHVDLQANIIVLFDIRIPKKIKKPRSSKSEDQNQEDTAINGQTEAAKKRPIELVPRVLTVSDIEAALSAGHAHLLSVEHDPYASLSLINEADIPEAHRKHRDIAWAVLRPLVLDEDDQLRLELFEPSQRHELILAAAKNYGGASRTKNDNSEGIEERDDTQAKERPENKSPSQHGGRSVSPEASQLWPKKRFYDNLRKWWRGGMVPNALLPYWHRSGPKNNQRNVTTKLGRPSNRSVSYGVDLGINIDAVTQDLLIRGYKKFYDPKQQYPWKHAYQRTCELFFNIGHELSPEGVPIPILLPKDQRPSLYQFKYYAERALNEDYVNELKRLFGLSTYNLTQRPLLGNSTQMALGPMGAYEVDAWIADTYLVSAFNRAWLIGKPVVYVVKDVYSRLVVGLAVGLEGPSWKGATLALINIVEDKVAFCARHGITISPDMWPNADFSYRILADRGEFEGYNANTLENAFGTTISNVAAYRGDLKAIVERDFLIMKNEVVKFVPGFTGYKSRNRGDRDYRLDACLTLYEFRQVIIRHILHYNNTWRMKNYREDPYAIAEGVPPIPIHLWNWGMVHRTGIRREPPTARRVRETLLPRGRASTTEHGLLFQKAYYNIALPGDEEGKLAERFFVEARVKGRQQFDVAYDPSVPETIYLCTKKDIPFIPCHILPSETSLYGRHDLDFSEVEDYWRRRENENEEHRDVSEQEIARVYAENQALYEKALAAAREAQEGLTKTERLSNIADNRQRDKLADATSQAAAHSAAPVLPPASHQSQPQQQSQATDYVAPPSGLAALQSLLDEDG